jgi:hypothetical protein
LQSFHDAGPLAQALSRHPVLDSGLEQHLHADADPKNRSPTRQAAADDGRPVDSGQTRHAGSEGTDSGNDQTVSIQGGFAIGSDHDLGSSASQSTLSRSKIA